MAELTIYAPIGYDWFGDGVTAKTVMRALRECKKDEEVVVRLNSPGGDAFEGVAIFNALKRHEGRIVIEVDALAASAASIIAMAGDEIRMAQGAMLMIHEAWGVTMGPAEDHEKQAELLRKLNGEMANIYAGRTGQKEPTLLELMAEETWMTGSEAKELGFCDVVHTAKAAPAPESKAAASLYGKYKRTPRSLRSADGPARMTRLDDPAKPPRARPAALRVPSPLGELGRAAASTRLGSR